VKRAADWGQGYAPASVGPGRCACLMTAGAQAWMRVVVTAGAAGEEGEQVSGRTSSS
jgi:hypothetical protein